MSTAYTYNYEQRTVNDTTTCYHYVASPDGLVAVYVKSGSTSTPYYVETDHLGSICKIYDASGNQKFSAAYDPWGKQTVSTKTLDLRRGYCAHEHWNQFGLIDMNFAIKREQSEYVATYSAMPSVSKMGEANFGRFYDPVVARFLSPDPYVQSPTNSQNYNLYSYCLNNPLKYTDPSGCITQLQMQISATISGSKYDEYNGGGGYGGGGGGRAGYSYNYTNGCYYDNYTGRRVDYSEVNNNYIKPNSTRVNVDYYQSYSVKESNGGYAYGDGKYVGCTYGGTNNTMLTVVYNNNGNVVASCIYEGGTSVVAKRPRSSESYGAQLGMFGTTIGSNISNVFGGAATAACNDARKLSAAKQAAQGYTTIAKIGRMSTIAGSVLSYGTTALEITTGNFNTHSIVDFGVATVGLISVGVAAIYSAPAIIIGTTIVGVGYGFASICGLSTTIDKASNNWGRKLMYDE